MIGIISTLILCFGIAAAFLALDHIGKRISAKITKRNEERNGTDGNGTAPEQ